MIDDDQEIEALKPIEKDPLESADLFGGAVSESDEEETSQKGKYPIFDQLVSLFS